MHISKNNFASKRISNIAIKKGDIYMSPRCQMRKNQLFHEVAVLSPNKDVI